MGLGHRDEAAEDRRVVDEVGVADDGAVGQRRHRGLEVQHLRDGHRDDVAAQRCEDAAQLRDALGVRAAAAADVDGVADLQHVAAVERAGRLDLDHRAAERLERATGAGGLGLAAVGAGARDDGDVLEHHDRVLDEHRVGAVVGGLDLDGLPAVLLQRRDVALPLRTGALQIDRHLLDVIDDAVIEQRTGLAHERNLRHEFSYSQDLAFFTIQGTGSGMRRGARMVIGS